jgi:AraC-like DNA-binding protein
VTVRHEPSGESNLRTLPHLRVGLVTYGDSNMPGNGFAIHRPVSGSVILSTGRGQVVATSAAPSVLSPGDAGPLRWESGTTALLIWIEPIALEHELVVMIGDRIDEPLVFQPDLALTQAGVRGWLELAAAVASQLDSAQLDHPFVGPYVERVLMRSLLLCQPNTYSQQLNDHRRDGRPPHVVAAIRVMEEAPQRPFTAASIAREVGVSARALQEGFRQHIGGTPMQFLRDARLRHVRLDLLSAGEERDASVSQVALRWGFTHLGRFASYYRARYGELPSQTLRAH